MSTRNRLIAAAALVGALATAGPVAGASAAQPRAVATPGTTIGSLVPCYPYPAYCGADGQPVAGTPNWVRQALGLPAAPFWQSIPILPLN
jgi:hypothetical protein